MKQGICSLCDEPRNLAESHIIPKFVFKWMKETGGNYFRRPLNPNQRMQDGIKEYLLCNDCEQILSKSEKWFSENIFYPYLNENAQFLRYNNKLSHFIISVLWRFLLTLKIDGKEYFEEVFNDWKSFLKNNSTLKYDNIHLVLLPNQWESDSQPNIYINRYFNRVAEISVIENTKIVYAKFSRFIICVDIDSTDGYFRGTNISLLGGRIPFAQYIADEKVSTYFVNRAEQVYLLAFSKISENEKEKIKNEILKNPTEFFKSDLGKSIDKDFNNKIRPFSYKKELIYNCDCCLKSIEEPEGYLLRTFEIIQSEEYWRFVFRRNSFSIKGEDLISRVEYFKEISSSQTPWIICDECIQKFKINREDSKSFMNEWISKKGKFFPPKCDDCRQYISQNILEEIAVIIVTVE